jgi:hypothetical protein
VQALTPTLFPCYAAGDREIAHRIAQFLLRGADVRVFLDEGEMRPGEDLASKAREARMADAVLVLFSRNSLPPRWPRAAWEAPLVTEPAADGVRIAFVRCDDCIPPKVLAPMFEARRLREIKRWLRRSPEVNAAAPEHAVDAEVLALDIADRPGVETVDNAALAAEFARVFAPDFDAVLRVWPAPTLAAAAGDLAAQLGLRLEGELPENLERLRAFCSERRLLILLEGEPRHELIFEGRCSTLISTEPLAAEPDPLRDSQRVAFSPTASWTEICAAARQARRLAHEQGRLAECCELMEHWSALAETRNDGPIQEEATRELVWILETWGRTIEAAKLDYRRAAAFDEQIPLAFDFEL